MHVVRSVHRVRVLAAGAAIALTLAIPAVALADTTSGTPSIQPAFTRNATIHVESITVTGKVVASVSLAFMCQPLQVFDWETGQTVETTVAHLEGGQVTLIQAQGRTIAWGETQLFGGTATCDGTTVNHVSAPVTAAVAPWKTGTAVVGASVYLIDDNMSASDYASTGPVTVRLSNR